MAKRKKKERIASPVKSLRGQEARYRKELNKLGKALIKAVNTELMPYLKANQSTYVIDGLMNDSFTPLSRITDKFIVDDDFDLSDDYREFTQSLLDNSRDQVQNRDGIGNELQVIFARLNQQFTGSIVSGFAQNTATQMVGKVARTNKTRFDKTIKRATGVDLGGIVASEGLEDFVTMNINTNVSLIKSLPEEYLKQVETIVNNGVVSGARFSTIAKEIVGIDKTANSKLAGRIKTIAMNEVQTINSQINLRRSDALGITEGIYRTSEDERVRTCHKELNGVRYELKKGAWSKTCNKFIKPGITDIN